MIIAQVSSTAVPLDLVLDQEGVGGVTGKAPTVAVRDAATLTRYLDWADATFKTSGWTTKYGAMTEVERGIYRRLLDASALGLTPGFRASAEYHVDDGGSVIGEDADDLLFVRSFDDLPADLAAAHGAGTWTTATGFATPADVTAARDSIKGTDARSLTDVAGAGFDSSTDSLAAADDDRESIKATAAAVLARTDVATSTRATPADVAAARDSVNTNVDAAEAAIRGGSRSLADLAAPGDAMALTPSERTTLAAVIDATLASAHGSGAWDATTAASTIADAVWATVLPGTYSAGTAGERLATTDDRVDVAVSTRSTLTAAQVDTQLSGAHGAGSWATATGFATPGDVAGVPAAVWAYLTASGTVSGSYGELVNLRLDAAVSTRALPLDVTLARDAILAVGGPGPWSGASPSSIASEVWNALTIDYTLAGSFGKLVGGLTPPLLTLTGYDPT